MVCTPCIIIVGTRRGVGPREGHGEVGSGKNVRICEIVGQDRAVTLLHVGGEMFSPPPPGRDWQGWAAWLGVKICCK